MGIAIGMAGNSEVRFHPIGIPMGITIGRAIGIPGNSEVKLHPIGMAIGIVIGIV